VRLDDLFPLIYPFTLIMGISLGRLWGHQDNKQVEVTCPTPVVCPAPAVRADVGVDPGFQKAVEGLKGTIDFMDKVAVSRGMEVIPDAGPKGPFYRYPRSYGSGK